MSSSRPTIHQLSVTTAEAIGDVFQKERTSPTTGRTADVFFSPGPGTGYTPSHFRKTAPRVFIAMWCKPHQELLDKWRELMGPNPIGVDDYSIGDLQVRNWPDGRKMIICTPRSHIGSMYFECSDSRQPIEIPTIDDDTNDYEIREHIKTLKREIARRQVDRRTTRESPLRSPDVS